MVLNISLRVQKQAMRTDDWYQFYATIGMHEKGFKSKFFANSIKPFG